jgi:uncharacterized protein with GYD domain
VSNRRRNPQKPTPRLGQIVVTKNALNHLGLAQVYAALGRHSKGDWGELKEHDRRANEQALKEGGRLLSVYWSKEDVKFYVITEADRSATTVLLAEEYRG